MRASELVALDGIADQSIFTYNVRGPLGRTKVNKDISKTIHEKAKHKSFPLFHNGITIIAGELDVSWDEINANDYFVVNGCQSLTALYANKKHITDDLKILTKFIKMDAGSPLAKDITEISNNQNGVKSRDFKSNHSEQIRLQNEFRTVFKNEFAFEIKRGEPDSSGIIISNETAGLYLMAFDLKEPWATHRKYEVFEDKYAMIFARPETTAHRIVLCQSIITVIKAKLPGIKNKLL